MVGGGGNMLLLGVGSGRVLKYFLVLNDGSKQGVVEVLRTAIDFWRGELAAKNLPSPYAQ